MEANPTLLAIMIITVIVTIAVLIFIFSIRRTTTSSNGQVVTTCTVPPTIPTGVTLSQTGPSSISVSWNVVKGAATYRAYLSTVNNFAISQAQIVKSTGNTTITFENLNTGFTYYIKVTAFNTCGESNPSAVNSIFIAFVPPSKFVIRNDVDNAIQLSMNPVAGVNSYRNFVTQNCVATNCHYQFNPTDNTIQLASDTTRCLTVVSSSQVWTVPCNSSSLVNRQWKYDPSDLSLCSTSDLNNACLLIPPGFTDPAGFGSFAVIGTKTNNARSEWDLVQV
jgi:hypothetical protein